MRWYQFDLAPSAVGEGNSRDKPASNANNGWLGINGSRGSLRCLWNYLGEDI